MKHVVEKGEKSTVKISITLTAKEWGEAQVLAYNKTKKNYKIQGFRPGCVPMAIVKRYYGETVFFEDAINESLNKYYYEILMKEKDIEPIDRPDVQIDKIDEKGLKMTLTVPVKPEVTIGAYKGIKIDKVEYNVNDDDIQTEVNRLLERCATEVSVDGRPAKDGDITIIDYSGSVDGVKFDGGTAEKQNLVIGSGSFIPGFEEQIIGMNIGDEKDINVKFPDEYHAENLKGKDAVFAIKLHKIEKKELPEVTDEWIKEAIGAESIEAYKAETKARMEKQNAERAERELEDEIIKKVTETSDVEIPDAMIENQIDRMVQEMEYRLSYQGLKLADYLKYMGKSMEDFRKDYTAQATEIVKSQLVIETIIEREEITATDEDVEKRVEEMAKAQGKPAPDVKKNMQARQLDYIKNEIIIKKFFEFLKNANTIE